MESSLRDYIGRRIVCHQQVTPTLFYNNRVHACIDLKLPREFHWRWLVDARDQGACTSCWAFSVSDMLADRLAIYTGGELFEPLSAQTMLSCFDKHFGCNVGGSPEDVYPWIAKRGIPFEYVYPYAQFEDTEISRCRAVPESAVRVFVQEHTIRNLCYPEFTVGDATHKQNIRNMQYEILLNGPIVGTVEVYQDLYNYRGGGRVYRYDGRSRHIGGHSCEIFGWGPDYWLCRTSWGADWPRPGENSVFRVKKGVNEVDIETRASSAIPLVPFQYAEYRLENTEIPRSAYHVLE